MTPPRWFLAAAAALLAGPAVAADVADLFPPGTLAYAEIRDPAKAAADVRAVLAGSPLADVLKFIDGRRDAAKTPNDVLGKPELALLGLVAAPEFAAEFGKLGGVAVGVTGFTAAGEPEAALAVLTGDSAAAGLAARAYLATGTVRRVAAVGTVPVYQFRYPNYTFDPNTGRQKFENDKPPAEGAYEATVAYTDGLFVYGTSKAAVAELLTRHKEQAGKALAGVAAFRAARAAHPHPGLFAYADPAAAAAAMSAARKEGGDLPEPAAVAWFRLLAGDGVKSVAGAVRVRDGGPVAEVSVAFDPAKASPLLGALSGPGATAGLLPAGNGGAPAAVALTLPETDRAAAVLALLDAAAKATGALGRTPGDVVKEFEAKHKLALADAVLAKTRAVTVLVPAKQQLGKGTTPLPTLVFHADTADAAAGWEEAFPKLAAELTGKAAPQPATETIDGVAVRSLPGAEFPWKGDVHYARKGLAVAVGLDRAAVAAAVTAAATPDKAGGPTDAPALLGAVRPGAAARELWGTAAPAGPIAPAPPTPAPPAFGPFGGPFGVPVVPANQEKLEAQKLDAVSAALDALPPLAVTGRRAGAVLRFEVVLPKGDGGFGPAVAAAVDWLDTYLNRNPFGGGPNPGGPFRRVR